MNSISGSRTRAIHVCGRLVLLVQDLIALRLNRILLIHDCISLCLSGGLHQLKCELRIDFPTRDVRPGERVALICPLRWASRRLA